jgi:hypothetical protein
MPYTEADETMIFFATSRSTQIERGILRDFLGQVNRLG